jgi:hypothetical protein
MSSATSTEKAPSRDQSLQPWQFFVLAALGCATAATFVARGQGVIAVILLSLLMAGAAFVGMAALRAVKPLVTKEEDRTPTIGRRTRAALEREKLLTLRAIKELEFDRAMGKLSEEDWNEMSGRLRARATRLMRQLDAGAGYREQIERDVAKKIVGDAPLNRPAAGNRATCASCSTVNDDDAKFCKGCGARLSLAD